MKKIEPLKEYEQMTLSNFLKIHPEFAKAIPFVDITDPRYVVRINGNIVELGFVDDSWVIR